MLDVAAQALREVAPKRFAALDAQALDASRDWIADFGLDSLDRTVLASALADFFCVFDSGEEDLLLLARNGDAYLERIAAARRAGSADITFRTSGTTGEPKRFRHRAERLDHEARAWAGMIETRFGRPRAVLRAIPLNHVYGYLWAALVPEALGLPVTPAIFRPWPTGAQAALANGTDTEGALVLATPRHVVQWQRQGVTLPGALVIVSGGAFPDAGQAAPWRGRLAWGLWEIYGSTETAGLGSRSDAGCYRWLDYITPVLEDGQVDRIVRTAPFSGPEELALPDRVFADADELNRGFLLGRRRDHVVKISGRRIDLEALCSRLSAIEGVEEAFVRVVRDGPSEGLSILIIAPGDGREALAKAKAWLVSGTDLAPLVSEWHHAVEAPLNDRGKIADWTSKPGVRVDSDLELKPRSTA